MNYSFNTRYNVKFQKLKQLLVKNLVLSATFVLCLYSNLGTELEFKRH